MTTYENRQTLGDILQQAETLKNENGEIIKRINGRSIVNRFQYNITQSMVNNCFKFDVTERQVEEHGNTIIDSWNSSIPIIVIPDIFNDKISYSCSNYTDLVRLNNEMHIVIQKYELFGDSERARQETLTFLKNFRLIQTNLNLIESSLKHEISKLEELKNKINDINSQFENLKTNHNLSFGLENHIPKGQLKCYKCGTIPTTMMYYKNDVEANRVDDYRKNGYSAVCVQHAQCAINKNWTFVGQY